MRIGAFIRYTSSPGALAAVRQVDAVARLQSATVVVVVRALLVVRVINQATSMHRSIKILNPSEIEE